MIFVHIVDIIYISKSTSAPNNSLIVDVCGVQPPCSTPTLFSHKSLYTFLLASSTFSPLIREPTFYLRIEHSRWIKRCVFNSKKYVNYVKNAVIFPSFPEYAPDMIHFCKTHVFDIL